MNLYEHTIVARQDISPSQLKQLEEKYSKIVEKNQGDIVKLENWGLMNLSYLIKKNKKGNYIHFKIKANGKILSELEKNEKIDKNLSLKPALFLKVKVAFIRIIDEGVSVSYGGKFVSSRKTKLAILSIGYADGVPRNLSGKINVIYNNKLYPQVGSITMDQMMVDITGSNEIKIGSTMVLLGSDGDKTISPIDWAKESNTIPWEILCSFKNRLPRVQVD